MEHWNDGTVYRLDGKQWRDKMEIDWMEMEMKMLMWLLMWLSRDRQEPRRCEILDTSSILGAFVPLASGVNSKVRRK